MQSTSSSSLHPALLPPGTQIGPWRVVDWAGRGVHGAVYRAVRIGQEHLPPVALKLAMLPEEPRFERERELLSRTPHPHIPRLVDHGHWLSPSGARHPFVAMQWVDGVSLYDWGRMFRPSAAQQLRLLSQVAFTLQSLHACPSRGGQARTCHAQSQVLHNGAHPSGLCHLSCAPGRRPDRCYFRSPPSREAGCQEWGLPR